MSPTPEIPEPLRDNLAQELLKGLAISDKPEIQEELKKIIEEETDAEDREEIESWLNNMQTRLDLLVLHEQISNKEKFSAYDKNTLDEFFEDRENILDRLLILLDNESTEEDGANTYAFKSAVIDSVFPTEDELEDIENTVFSYTDQRNELHHGKNIVLPNFAKIEEMRQSIQSARNNIDTKADVKDKKATLARLNRIETGLEIIYKMDPIGKLKTMTMADELVLRSSHNLPAVTSIPEDPNNPTPRNAGAMLARGGGLVIGSFLFILTAIQAAWKLKDGKPLGISALMTPIYGYIVYELSGSQLFGGKMKTFMQKKWEISKLHVDLDFQKTLKNMGGKEKAAEAAENLHDILQDKTKKKEFESLMEGDADKGLERKQIETFTDGSGNLFEALNESTVTNKDRHYFMKELQKKGIDDEDKLDIILDVIRYTD